MGLLDKFKKGGGGFLNQVDGVITGFKFTTEPEFGGGGTRKKSDNTPLFVALTVQVDGAEKPETTHLFAGSGDEVVVSEDGLSIEFIDGTTGMWGNTAFAQFYQSAVENDLTDPDPVEGEPLSFAHLVGVRARFVQVKDEAAMKRAAKSHRTSGGKINEMGQKKSKDGKFYDIRTLQVEKVYSEGNAVAAPKAKGGKTAKPAAKGAKAPAGKPAPATEDVSEFAQDTLIAILGKNDNTVKKAGLNLAVSRHLVKDERREAVRGWLADDANLDTLADAGIIEYADGVITLQN